MVLRKTVLPLVALLSGIGVLVIGNGLLGTLVAVRAATEGFANEAIAIVMASYFVGILIGSVYGIRIVERAGHIRTFAGLAAVASATSLGHAFFVTPLSWSVLRALTGFCFAGLYIVTESWLNERATTKNRGRILSLYLTVNLGGLAGGQLLLPLSDPALFDLFCIASILLSLGLVPVTMTKTPEPTLSRVHGMHLGSLFALSPLGFVCCFGSGLTMGAFWGMGPVYARETGMDQASIAAFMAITIAGGLFLQWPVGAISDRVDRRKIIVAACVLGGVTSLTAIFLGGVSGQISLIAACLFGGCIFSLYSLGVAHVNDHVETHDFVAASSALLLVYGAGAVIGPILAGVAMGRFGGSGFYYYQAAIFCSLVVFALYRMRMRPAIPVDERTSIVIVPRTSPVATALDPRAPSDDADRLQ